jgi:hypothetical protein
LKELENSFGMDWGFNSGPCGGRIAALEINVVAQTGNLKLYRDISNWVYKLKTSGFTVGLVYRELPHPIFKK